MQYTYNGKNIQTYSLFPKNTISLMEKFLLIGKSQKQQILKDLFDALRCAHRIKQRFNSICRYAKKYLGAFNLIQSTYSERPSLCGGVPLNAAIPEKCERLSSKFLSWPTHSRPYARNYYSKFIRAPARYISRKTHSHTTHSASLTIQTAR